MRIVARELKEVDNGVSLPDSQLLFLAGDVNTESGAVKIQEFLSGSSETEMVTIIRSPMPSNEQIEKSERNGKKTDKVDNSNVVVSRTQTYARANETLGFGDTEFDDGSLFQVKFSISQKQVVDPNAEEA